MFNNTLPQEKYLAARDKIWLSSPHMGLLEKRYLMEAFESNWIAPLGPFVDRFEKEIENVEKEMENVEK